MNKQTMSAIAIVLIACLIGFGLTNLAEQTALERFESLMTSNVELTSYRTEATGNMKMELVSDEEIPEYLKSTFKMYENMKIYVLADYVVKPENFQMRILEKVDMGGMTFEIEGYLNQNELIVKYPIIGDYILITIEDLQTAFDFELPENFMVDLYALIPEVQKDSMDIMSKYITEEHVKYGEPRIIETNGYEEKLHAVEVTYDSEMIINIYADMILALLDNEKGQALLESVIEINDGELPEDLSGNIDELKQMVIDVKNPESEVRQSFNDETGDILDQMNFTVTLGLSNLNIPKAMWAEVDMIMPLDIDDSTNMHMQYNLEYRFSKFNDIDNIEIPEIPEDDMIRLSELIEKFGGY